jgi:hypothetical protein
MAYVEPKLTLIGQASGVVLGISPDLAQDDAGLPAPYHFDSGAALESEW